MHCHFIRGKRKPSLKPRDLFGFRANQNLVYLKFEVTRKRYFYPVEFILLASVDFQTTQRPAFRVLLSRCPQRSITGIKGLARARSGAAGVEFALLLPVLVLLLMGMFDYGALAYQTMQVSAAAHAGADYALHSGWNLTAVQSAVTNATTLASVSATPAPTLSQGCITNGALVITTGSSCPSGGTPGSYVVINAQAPFSPLVIWSAFGLPSTITAKAVVRIQ
jgi:Flp pilus assembly protein TadG